MMKRLFDFSLAAFSMLLLSPVFIVSFLAVKLSSKGPGIFKQERIGLHGQPFMIYKFRTMVVNEEDEGTPQLAEINDDRLTKIGAWLRSHHLDELPQLWNVLKGDMSFVGYRPERQYFINQIIAIRPDYQKLYDIRPGITSLATIYNGYTNNMEKMIRRLDMDLDYLNHMSLREDLRIIFLTVVNILAGKKI
jgi:lipopolysaccharide/colanic/teichoic acid biosynthesis glycosyltransferase